MKIRVRYRRWGAMKFLGHLDLMRYFQRAIRRAEVDICYSEGFSPHQIMSFAAPLGVGITSDGEYFDIEVHSTKSSAETIADFNNTMVDGIQVTGYVQLPDKSKTAMSIVAAADYTLTYKEGYSIPYSYQEWCDKLEEVFLSKEEFKIIKKTARSEKELDLRKLVYRIEIKEADGKPAFGMMICTGSTDNIKPELVLEHLYNACGLTYEPAAIQIHRNETYARTEEGFISLLDMGQEIM